MKDKHIVARFCLGFAVANLIGSVLDIFFSYVFGDGEYMAVMPQLARFFDNEINAAAVQFLIIGFIGVLFAESALIFNIEKWSFLKKCIIHLTVTACFYFPFILLCYLPYNTVSAVIMICNVIFTYMLTWVIQYSLNRRDVAKINERIREVRENERN